MWFTAMLTQTERLEATDALWAIQAYVGSRQLDDKAFKAADVNLDKEVNTSDALAILACG